MCGLSGFSRKEFFNRFALNALPLIHPDDQAGLLQNLMDAARDSLSINRDIRLLKKNGSPFWINLRADVLVDQGSSTTFYAILLDIDQSHREREALAEVSRKAEVLERQYAALLDSLPGGYCVLRCQSAATLPQVEQISGGLCRMTGYSEKELLRHMGEDPLWLIHPDDRDAAAAAMRLVPLNPKRGIPVHIIVVVYHKVSPLGDGLPCIFWRQSVLIRRHQVQNLIAHRAGVVDVIAVVVQIGHDIPVHHKTVQLHIGIRQQRIAWCSLSPFGSLSIRSV